MKREIDYEALKIFLESLKDEDFEKYKNREKFILKEANTVLDHPKEIWNPKYIQYWEQFLVDIIGNDLSVVTLSKKKHKIWGRGWLNCILEKTIISDCRKVYWTPLNWYWIIPDKFYK